MKNVKLVRQGADIFYPATEYDKEQLNDVMVGTAINVKYTKTKSRSLQHHKLYFGGLLGLAMEYWDPSSGVMSTHEESILREFAVWLDKLAGRGGLLQDTASEFIDEVKSRRREKIQSLPARNKAQLHEWVKIQAGYYDVVVTPGGIKKVAQSIRFDSMSQDQFNEFYKLAFNVVWNFILSKVFKDELECNRAINELMSMS